MASPSSSSLGLLGTYNAGPSLAPSVQQSAAAALMRAEKRRPQSLSLAAKGEAYEGGTPALSPEREARDAHSILRRAVSELPLRQLPPGCGQGRQQQQPSPSGPRRNPPLLTEDGLLALLEPTLALSPTPALQPHARASSGVTAGHKSSSSMFLSLTTLSPSSVPSVVTCAYQTRRPGDSASPASEIATGVPWSGQPSPAACPMGFQGTGESCSQGCSDSGLAVQREVAAQHTAAAAEALAGPLSAEAMAVRDMPHVEYSLCRRRSCSSSSGSSSEEGCHDAAGEEEEEEEEGEREEGGVEGEGAAQLQPGSRTGGTEPLEAAGSAPQPDPTPQLQPQAHPVPYRRSSILAKIQPGPGLAMPVPSLAGPHELWYAEVALQGHQHHKHHQQHHPRASAGSAASSSTAAPTQPDPYTQPLYTQSSCPIVSLISYSATAAAAQQTEPAGASRAVDRVLSGSSSGSSGSGSAAGRGVAGGVSGKGDEGQQQQPLVRLEDLSGQQQARGPATASPTTASPVRRHVRQPCPGTGLSVASFFIDAAAAAPRPPGQARSSLSGESGCSGASRQSLRSVLSCQVRLCVAVGLCVYECMWLGGWGWGCVCGVGVSVRMCTYLCSHVLAIRIRIRQYVFSRGG